MRRRNRNEEDILKLVTEIVAAYVSKNPVAADDLPGVIKSVHATLGGIQAATGARLRASAGRAGEEIRDARLHRLPGRRQETEDAEALSARPYGLTPEAYRAKWNLPADYPMTAPNYAAKRSEFAKQIGLGQAQPQERGV